ncbi:uncharacterized protein LOC115777171 isoform X3 [Archocentrus centrarchus]|nr:uncharacterized protein LOC115777171 isoform X3 [Archocentrus centrarchus]
MAESQVLKNIGDAIAGVLPDLPDQLVKSVEDTLKTLGAATTDDLKYITENDLLPVLKPIQARRLVAAWTQNSSSCFAAETFMLSIDKKIVNDRITTFTSAICLMFGSYYCFNIHYPVELRSTLEFLQRCFFSINPERGTKVESKKKKVFSVNPRVLTLISDIAD